MRGAICAGREGLPLLTWSQTLEALGGCVSSPLWPPSTQIPLTTEPMGPAPPHSLVPSLGSLHVAECVSKERYAWVCLYVSPSTHLWPRLHSKEACCQQSCRHRFLPASSPLYSPTHLTTHAASQTPLWYSFILICNAAMDHHGGLLLPYSLPCFLDPQPCPQEPGRRILATFSSHTTYSYPLLTF